MRKILITLCIIAFYCTSCDSLLDVKTKHAISKEKVVDLAGCESLILGVYDQMQSEGFAGRDLILIPEVMGDNCVPTRGATKYLLEYEFAPRHGLDVWSAAYKQIGGLNEALHYLKNLPQTSEAKHLTGEALFLRAYDYFCLANVYSRVPEHLVDGFDLCVPLILEPFFNSSGESLQHAKVPRSSAAAVWKQITDDLKEAFALMQPFGNEGFPNRGSAIAAKALLSRTYLYLGQWGEAAAAATYVLDNAPVAVYDCSAASYTDVFSKGKESLWQLTFTRSENLSEKSLHSAYGAMGDANGAGEKQVSVNEEFVALLDAADSRRDALRQVEWLGERIWWTVKFNSWGGIFGLDNIPLIRISEVLLTRAEAYVHDKEYARARADLDFFLSRRSLPASDVSDSALLDNILVQRRLELAFEGHRLFDCKRLGRDISRPAGMPPIPYSDYRVVASLPNDELESNKALVNNPGY